MPDCTTVTITGETGSVEAIIADTSVDGSTVTVSAYVNNTGDQYWEGDLSITLNGTQEATETTAAGAGRESPTVEFTLEGVPDGDHEVCAEASGEFF